MEFRPGLRLVSAVCETNIIVVKPPTRAGVLHCGGKPMLTFGDKSPLSTRMKDNAGGTLLGKRYVCADAGLEVLCTKPGDGSLTFDEVPLTEQSTKPLPPSD